MIEKSMGLLVYLKKRSGYKKGALPIYVRVTIDGISKEISTKRNVLPIHWNSNAQRVKGSNDEAKSINYFLDTLILQTHDARRRLLEEKKAVTAEAIKNAIQGRADAPKMLLQIFQHHNDQMKELIGKEYAPGTLERYKISLEHTRNFIKTKYGVVDIDIAKLDFEFVTEYEFWLRSVRSCGHNSTMKYISNLKKIINRCLRNGWLAKDPFIGFKTTKRDVERTALTPEELQAITDKKFQMQRLSQVRDIFVFACFTGLAYADVQKLTKSEIVVGIDGEQWICTHRQKTEASSRIPLLPIAKAIMQSYDNHPQCRTNNFVLPVLSNQKMNAYLKEIADVCGIDKTLTFHLARHTFATTVTLSNGVPIESVSKMLGHKNLKTTQLYAKVLDTKVSNDMQLLKEKLNKAS